MAKPMCSYHWIKATGKFIIKKKGGTNLSSPRNHFLMTAHILTPNERMEQSVPCIQTSITTVKMVCANFLEPLSGCDRTARHFTTAMGEGKGGLNSVLFLLFCIH